MAQWQRQRLRIYESWVDEMETKIFFVDFMLRAIKKKQRKWDEGKFIDLRFHFAGVCACVSENLTY